MYIFAVLPLLVASLGTSAIASPVPGDGQIVGQHERAGGVRESRDTFVARDGDNGGKPNSGTVKYRRQTISTPDYELPEEHWDGSPAPGSTSGYPGSYRRQAVSEPEDKYPQHLYNADSPPPRGANPTAPGSLGRQVRREDEDDSGTEKQRRQDSTYYSDDDDDDDDNAWKMQHGDIHPAARRN